LFFPPIIEEAAATSTRAPQSAQNRRSPLSMRKQASEQLHSLQGDVLRIDKQLIPIGHRLDRIERRLGLLENAE
jgi:hypothetical protein